MTQELTAEAPRVAAVDAAPAARPASGASLSRAARGAGARGLPILLALVGIIALWYLVSYVFLSESRRFLLPPPHQVITETIGNPQIVGPMLQALGQTTSVALVGLGLAVVIGMAWAILMSQWRLAESILYPYAVILQTIPILALTPLIGIWMGYGIPARIVVCVIIAVFR